MKYPYIGKSESGAIILFTSGGYGFCIDGGKADDGTPYHVGFAGKHSDGWDEGNFTNITREYLANTWGEVKSEEHAEFLIELCASNGISCAHYNLHCKCFSVDHDGLYFWSNETMARAYGNGEKQTTIPEPPQQNTNTPEEDFEMKQIMKNNGDNLIFAPENDFKTARNKAKELRKEMGCSDENLVSRLGFAVGDEVKAVSFNGQVTVKGRLLAITKEYVIIQKPDREQHLFISSWNFKKPKTPEEELRDDLTDLVMRARDADATDSVIANSIMAKYNITKKN